MKGSDMGSDFEGCCQLLEQLAAPRTMAIRLAAADGRDETAVPVAPAALFLIREVQYPVESSLYILSRGARGKMRGSKCTREIIGSKCTSKKLMLVAAGHGSCRSAAARS